jgi:hypothetical protein
MPTSPTPLPTIPPFPVLAPIVSEYLLILDGGGNGFAGTWSNAGSGKAGVVIITEFVLTAV